MWIIGISKLNTNISCFTVYDQPATKHWRNRMLGTSKCKSYLICFILRVNVLLFSDFNASGVLNNNGTPCFVISLTSTFFFHFLNDQNCELSPETADNWFDEVSFFCHDYWIFSLQDYCYCCVHCSTSLRLFCVLIFSGMVKIFRFGTMWKP